MSEAKKILCIVTGGPGDGLRARRLAASLDAEVTFVDVDKALPRRTSSRLVWQALKADRWELVYQEGTGIAGGLNLIRAARQWGQRFIVSSGDPIGGFFTTTQGRAAGAAFEAYERLLYRHGAGFIGWTPYLTGMALKMGARMAATVEGGVDPAIFRPYAPQERDRARQDFGIRPGDLVCGVVGSLNWTKRQSYCYGLELVKAIGLLKRPDVSVLIVGDGTGKAVLEGLVPAGHRDRVHFTGRLPQAAVVSAMNAMDIGFITQTLDGLGSYRLTTKLPEYLACGLPVAMSPVPGYFDYALPAGWPLPARHPADARFHRECALWLDGLSREDVAEKAARARAVAEAHFDYRVVVPKFRAFVDQILAQP